MTMTPHMRRKIGKLDARIMCLEKELADARSDMRDAYSLARLQGVLIEQLKRQVLDNGLRMPLSGRRARQ